MDATDAERGHEALSMANAVVDLDYEREKQEAALLMLAQHKHIDLWRST